MFSKPPLSNDNQNQHVSNTAPECHKLVKNKKRLNRKIKAIPTAVYSHASLAGSCRVWFAAFPALELISFASRAVRSPHPHIRVRQQRKDWRIGHETL